MEIDYEGKLPTKASDTLELAIADLEKCEQDPRYAIDMGEWHRAGLAVCYVCLAGSVLAQTLRVPSSVSVNVGPPHKIPDHVRGRLLAINDFREGRIADGLMWFDDEPRDVGLPIDIDVTSYEDDPDEFKQDMRGIIQMLREEGL